MSNLASCYIQMGCRNDAIKMQEQVVYTRQRILGEEHPCTLVSMENLATMYSSLDLAAQDPKARRETDDNMQLDRTHFLRLNFLCGLAQTYDKLGYLDKAKFMHESAVNIATRLYGPEHKNTLAALNNLAVNFGYQGLNDEAARLYKKIMGICQKDSAVERLTMLRCMSNLASCLCCLGSTQEAFDMHYLVMEECISLLDLHHPVAINAFTNLRDSYRKTGHLEEALRLDKYLLKMDRWVTSEKNSVTMSSGTHSSASSGDRAHSPAQSKQEASIHDERPQRSYQTICIVQDWIKKCSEK